MRSTIVLSAEGLISAIEEEWLFDDLYSAAILKGLKEDSPENKSVVSDFAAEVIENLGPYGYFMRIIANGRPVKLNTVTQFKSEMKGQQLQLSFTAPLAEPVSPMRDEVSFSVYDPTYFIQMTHRPLDPPTIRSDKSHSCRAQVKPPNPTPEDIERAFALDRGWTATWPLIGIHRLLDQALGSFVASANDEHCRLAQRFVQLAQRDKAKVSIDTP